MSSLATSLPHLTQVLREVRAIYRTACEGVINLADKFFEMERTDALKVGVCMRLGHRGAHGSWKTFHGHEQGIGRSWSCGLAAEKEQATVLGPGWLCGWAHRDARSSGQGCRAERGQAVWHRDCAQPSLRCRHAA